MRALKKATKGSDAWMAYALEVQGRAALRARNRGPEWAPEEQQARALANYRDPREAFRAIFRFCTDPDMPRDLALDASAIVAEAFVRDKRKWRAE